MYMGTVGCRNEQEHETIYSNNNMQRQQKTQEISKGVAWGMDTAKIGNGTFQTGTN